MLIVGRRPLLRHLGLSACIVVSAGLWLLWVVVESQPTALTERRPAPADRIGVRAADRGAPLINLADGHDLVASYAGPLAAVDALDQNHARGLSMTTGDFDEDGVPDLVCGYAGPRGGIIALHRGNVDSIYPNSLEAQRRREDGTFTSAPFLSPALVSEAPSFPDFIGAGDFDGDGHCDLVVAARGADRLFVLLGDGMGQFTSIKPIALPGVVTTMTTGDINRRDGLEDFIVGISGPLGPEVLVFEGPTGAATAEPECFALPAETTGLALGQLDEQFPVDMAVASGRELIIIHGRDRKLSTDVQTRGSVAEAAITRERFDSSLRSVVSGDFAGDHSADIALLSEDGVVHLLTREADVWRRRIVASGEWSVRARLFSARLSSLPFDSPLMVDGHQLGILTPPVGNQEPALAFEGQIVRLDIDGECAAVLAARLNLDALSDLVVLREGQDEPAVVPSQPAQMFTVTTDDNAGTGSLREAITLANANPGPDLISFSIPGAGPHTIKPRSPLPEITDPITIDGTTQPGFAGMPLIELNGARLGSDEPALLITSGNCMVRGLVVNRAAVNIEMLETGGNVIEGNFIGTDPSGGAGAGSQGDGVKALFSPSNRIGGTTVQARNIISGNDDGVGITDSSDNVIIGNFIGTNREGNAAVGNTGNGVDLNGSVNATITGNLISGNGGPDRNNGINGYQGRGNLIQDNLIGVDTSGANPLGNGGSGVVLVECSDTVGGTAASARNVIAANGLPGIGSKGVGIVGDDATRPSGCVVQGNFIGTDTTGTRAIPNFEDGVGIRDLVETLVGGVVEGARNVISGNAGDGVGIGVLFNGRTGGTRIVVAGNFIGTDVTGTHPLGNELNGVFVEADSIINTIDGNRIAFNRLNGVLIPDNRNPGVRIAITSNSIYSNGQLGVDLGPPGVTPNDELDADTGANELQNFPELSTSSASPTAASSFSIWPAALATVGGTLSSKPNTTYTLEFFFGSQCRPSGSQSIGEIPIPLKPTLQVTTNSGGRVDFIYSFEFPAGRTAGVVICTATDPEGNTSEESPCIGVALPGCPPPVSPTARSFPAAGGSDVVNVFAAAECNWSATSNSEWITIASGIGGVGPGVVRYSVADNAASSSRSGAITIADRTVEITQEGRVPRISSAVREGKQLIVTGENFEDDSRILINGARQKTANDPESPTTRLIAPKAGKVIRAGDSVQVRNPDGALSPEFIYTGR